MHGAALPVAIYRRFDDHAGIGWCVGVSGTPEAIEGTYDDAPPYFQLTVHTPGWFYLVVQADTGGDDTEIELIQPAAEAINTLGRWKRATFVQCESITESTDGKSDPSFTNLTRHWMPYPRVAIAWLIKTTTVDEIIKWRITSGVDADSQTFHAFIWRLVDWDQSQTQFADCARFDAIISGSGAPITATRLNVIDDLFVYGDRFRHRVVCSGSPGSDFIYWPFITAYSGGIAAAQVVLPEYQYRLRVAIVTTPDESVTGTITVRVFAATAGEIHAHAIAYSTSETVYTHDFTTRSAGDQINQIRLTGLVNGDKFDVEVSLDVIS